MTLGTTIRRLRQANGLSQRAFAEKLEITPSYLSLLEADKREATIPLLRRMAQVLGSPATVLFVAALAGTADARPEERKVVEQLVEAMRLNLLQERLPLGFRSSDDLSPDDNVGDPEAAQ